MPRLLPDAPVAVRIPAAADVAPFGEPAAGLPVLGVPLARVQDEALAAAGVRRVDEAPTDRPYLVYSDRVWFTASFVRALLQREGTGRVRLAHDGFVRATGPLLADPARPELARVPAGERPRLDLPDLPLDLPLEEVPPPDLHPAFRHAAAQGWFGGPAVALGIEHWVHLLRANLLALGARGHEAVADFRAASLPARIRTVAGILARVRGLGEAGVARAISRIDRTARVHPTAVVEACEVGPGAEIGPGAVLRGVIVGAGAHVDAQAYVAMSVVGPRARVGRGAMLTLSVLLDGALVSAGFGFQMSVFGRDAFVAQGVTALDLSFGAPIRVDTPAGRAEAGGHFLGVCVGHRARLGAGVRLGYGVTVPNDVLLVAPSGDLVRRFAPDPSGPLTVVDGVAVPVSRA